MQSLATTVFSLNTYLTRNVVEMNLANEINLVTVNLFTLKTVSNECYFCEKSECRKFKCRHLNAYKVAEKIHLNDRNRIYLRLAERSEALIKFIRERSQRKMMNLALRD